MNILFSNFCVLLMLASTPVAAQVAESDQNKVLIQVAPGKRSAINNAPLTKAQTQRVVDGLIDQIKQLYVFPKKRQLIVEAIQAEHARAQFSELTPAELALRLSTTLFAASNDKHLNVSFDPTRSKALTDQPDPLDHAFFDAEGLRLNQGYVRQEILPGNVRYVRIQMFFWTDKVTEQVIDSAAQFLSGGSAVIIDLRGNGGGHATAVQRLISYLMPPKSTPLMTFFDGRTGKSEVLQSTVKLPSSRITGRPTKPHPAPPRSIWRCLRLYRLYYKAAMPS